MKKLGLTLTLFTLLPGLIFASEPDEVIVVGAGIVGASIAYHLAADGVKVTVLERQAPASHASRGTFAWLNASWAKQPFEYHQLNQRSVAYWHELSQSLSIPVKWGGSLEWFNGEKRSNQLKAQISEQQDWGELARILTAQQARALEPNVQFPGDATIAYSANDGAVDPQVATWTFLAAAKKLGAKVRYPCNVTSIATQLTEVTLATSCGEMTTSKVVLAVGANSKIIREATGINIPQRTTPGIIAVTKPLPRLIDRILVAPGVHIHQRVDGRVVIGEQDGAPDTHKERLAKRPNSYPDDMLEQQHFQRMLAIAVKIIPELGRAELEEMFIGWRPLPLDGHPALGFSDSSQTIYIAVMHSGVTLSPIVGKLVAKELQGEQLEQLQAYRPQRSFELIKRY